MSSVSSIISKVRQEAALFDFKDRLLNFSSKDEFQSPLIMEAGDLFYEKWRQSEGPLPMDSFFPIRDNFNAQQKRTITDSMLAVLREKMEDFGTSDLYLVLGFLKWDGNALAPSLLIPVDVDINKKTLSLSKHAPVENVILRERLKDKIDLPKAEDATINGQFSILLYFSLFEKAIASERNWKFTRHGLCLGFFNTGRLLMKKRLETGWTDKQIDSNPVLSSLLRDEGFEVQESLFEDNDFDKVFSPAEHHFLYQTDSHTTKATMDALSDKACTYAIQALPGTSKMKVVANIVAESVANNRNVLVVTRRAVTASSFQNAWKPPFRTFNENDREGLAKSVQETRASFLNYYDAVNKPLQPSGTMLSELLSEFAKAKAPKQKYPEKLYQGILNLNYVQFKELKADLDNLVDLYFNKSGIETRKAFQSVKVPSLTAEHQQQISDELNRAAEKATELSNVVKIFESAGLFPTGIFLSSLADILQLIKDNIDENTLTYEQWELRSSNWESYRDTLVALPEAGDKWVRYRRQTSEIYIDTAVDENILSAREDFAESQKATLKGLSDRYRSSRRRLMQMFRNPKDISSDAQLLDQIDALLELQDNKKAYKESAVLGNHLLGRDWMYERSNWVELNQKITALYEFRDQHKRDPKLDLLLQILEQWHILKELRPELDKYLDAVKDLQKSVRQISKDMELETPLESLDINKWLDTIKSWSENWNNLNVHLQLTSLFNKLEEYNCPNLVEFVRDPSNVSKEVAQAVVHFWAASQIQGITKTTPELFTLNPKARAQKSKAYRELLDKFCNANFKQLHDSVSANPELLTIADLNETASLSSKAHFNLAIILDSDCISVVDALPSILCSDRVILVGDPHNPSLEKLPFDAYQETMLPHTPLFVESILATSLRQGVPTRELWFSTLYSNADLVSFANKRIYNNGIKQFPTPTREDFKGIRIKTVQNKILAIAQAAVRHAEKNPGKTLGIIAFHQSTCHEIDSAIQALIAAGTPAANFFNQTNPNIRYFVKTPERAIDRFRDEIFVCAESDGASGLAGDRKISVCTTLAKCETTVFISENELSKQANAKPSLFWEWISFLQKKDFTDRNDAAQSNSVIRPQVVETLEKENIQLLESFCHGGIPVGPAVVDANNPKRFLMLIEDDCSVERFRDSVEDKTYTRPNILGQLGWKIQQLWLPFWYMARADETGHLVATIAIEQSVAPPPSDSPAEEMDEDLEEPLMEGPIIEAYIVQHPKIEGTPHDKPIAELPAAAIITQLKFYVDHEAPIHEEILKQRVLELHHVDRAGPMIQQALVDAINQGLQKKRFVKTGPFFYSLKPTSFTARNRSARPDFERKLAYVGPEERALLPLTMDEHAIKQALGLLE